MRLYEFDTKARAEKDFEKVLFGDLKKSTEKDTKVEKSIFQKLKRFITNPSPDNKEAAHKALQYLKKFKEIFPGDLKSQHEIAYRGTVMNAEEFKEKFSKIINKKMYKNGKIIKIPFTYRAKSEIQSWTTNESVAKKFSEKMPYIKKRASQMRSNIPLIVTTKIDDTFLFNPTLTNRVTEKYTEYEVIRLSKRPKRCTLIIDTRDPRVFKFLEDPDESFQIEVINSNPWHNVIRWIKNPSERVQKVSIDHNYRSIQHIENPSENIQVYAIQHTPEAILYIKKPTPKVQIAAIDESTNPDPVLYHIKNLSRDGQLFALAVFGPSAAAYFRRPTKEAMELYKKIQSTPENERPHDPTASRIYYHIKSKYDLTWTRNRLEKI